ncbi:sirohydrochlorin chelatase, partial [Streptomyces sp. YC537]|nr:sirohydrochlorin chelatase [Streptomyces boluensis]
GIASAPLGTHPAVAELLLHRYDEAAHTYARPATPHLHLATA